MSFVQQNEFLRDPVVVSAGVTEPSYYDTITLNGETIIWQMGDTVVFFMRPLLSRVPVINGLSGVKLSPPDEDGNNVRYDWQPTDVVVEGQYMGWWGYELTGAQLAETPEFPIVITDHGPGYGTATGVVVDGISMWLPTTVHAMREAPEFGDRFLQQHADYVKRSVLGQVVAPDLEVNYDPALVEYLSKRTAVRLITPAMDYWARQYRSATTQGPSEQVNYPDMLQNLKDLHHRLSHELVADWLQLQAFIPDIVQLRQEPAPASSLGDPSDPRNRARTGNPYVTPPARTGGPFWGGFFMP